MLKRLTVHLTDVKPEKVKTGNYDPKTNKEVVKTVLNNTISVRNLTSNSEITAALSKIRSENTIHINKQGDELWYTSNEII